MLEHKPLKAASIVLAIGLALTASACSGASPTASPAVTPSAAASATPAPSEGPAKFAPATSVKLEFDDNAQTVLIGDNGRRVFIDVYFPTSLPKPDLGPNDILLTTHRHDDHYMPDFVNAFPGERLTDQAGSIAFDDVKITGLDAAHDEGPMGSDHIYVIDFAGLRIVHFGDLGQAALTDEQLAAIGPGKVDIAMSQTYNDSSNMDATNEKGIKLMQQVQPKIFIPTHSDGDTITAASKLWPTTYSTKTLTFTKSMIPAKTTMLILGHDASFYASLLNLQEANW